MATLTVCVVPRSARSGVELRGTDVLVRVHAAPVGGKANQEAGRVLAAHLGVPPSAVVLRSGARSRTKVFDVETLDEQELSARLGAGETP